MSIRYERVLITPEIANGFLLKNTNNRKMSRRQVLKWVHALNSGTWKENGDAIRFNDKGNLIDGQHRCQAIVEAGASVWSMVVTGIDSDAFWTIDKGCPKSTAFTLTQKGEKSTSRLAGALALVDRYIKQRLQVRADYSTEEILSILEAHPTIRESVSMFCNTKHIMPPTVAIACHYLFAKRDALLSDMFMRCIIDNDSLIKGSAMWMLRQRLDQNLMSKTKLSNEYIMALTIKAWNSERSKTEIKNLRFIEQGDKTERFPVII